MGIILNDNIQINAGKPSESKYLTTSNTAYASVSAANLALPIPVRYIGLTVNINNIEYWYKDGVADINLIEKKYDSTVPAGDFVTGGTSVGYFSGFTGIQTLPIDNMTDNTYDGNYNSVYNYYYRGTDQKIHVGTPSDGIPKRGYVKTTGQVKSWIWNELNNYPMGWIFVSGDVADQIGTVQPGVPYYTGVGISQPYTYTSWTSGAPVLPVQGWAAINTILGSLTTGSTYTNGAPVYAGEVDQVLQFRTIMTKTPGLISVTNDEALVYLSGKTPTVLGSNVGVGVGVYKDTTVSGGDTTLNFRKILGGGNTVVSQSGDTIIVFSSGGTGGGSGDTYNLSSPAAITVGGIASGTTLIGKTSFELFEELLVPTLYPTLIAPFSAISLTPSGTFEVGCNIATLCVDATYNPGAITPQYSSLSSCRSKGTTLYCFTGLGVGGPYGSTLFNYQVISPNYCVCAGANTASVHNCYCVGVQPKDSKGNNYSTPLVAGDTADVSASITGLFPYFWGKLASGSRPAVTNALITGGTKVIASSTGTVTITFNSSTSDYTWLAIPQASTSKTCWYVNALDNGKIATAPSDKYPDECLISIYSGQGCWMGAAVNYKVYMSGTVGAISAPMEFRNS
jgi:hypothetical protein